MQHYIETEGDTVEEAIEHALTELEATRDQVTIDIVSEPTKGILNFGAKPAKVRATLKPRCLFRTGNDSKGNAQPDGNRRGG